MRLGATDEILELQTSAAQTMDWTVSYIDIPATGASVCADGEGTVSTATTTTIVPAPASGNSRQVQHITVRNRGAAANTINIKKDKAGTEYLTFQATLNPGDCFEWTPNQGARLVDTGGGQRQALGNQVVQTGVPTYVILASDVTNNNAVANTIADVTGMSFAVTAGQTYWFRFTIFYTAAATTTGSRWTVNGPGSPTTLSYTSKYPLTATTQTVNYATAYDIPAASNASSLTAGNVAVIEGFITPSANGTVIARFASEIASSAIVAKAGSILEWYRTL